MDWRVQWSTAVDEVAGVAVSIDGILVAGHRAVPEGPAHDVVVVKNSLEGKVIWSQQFGSSSTDLATALACDKMGDVFVVGTTRGALFGDSKGGLDSFIVKLDGETGARIWAQQIGTEQEDSIYAAAVDSEANVFVCGTTAGQLYARTTEAPQVMGESFCAKLRGSDGKLVWGTQLAKGANDGILGAAAVAATGDLAVAGYTSAGTGPAAGSMTDFFISKLAGDSGRVLWSVTGASGYASDEPDGAALAAASQFSDAASAVAVDSAGDIVAAGYTEGALFLDGDLANPTGRRRYDVDGMVVKVSGSDGRRLWGRQLSAEVSGEGAASSANVFANAVAFDENDDVLLCGTSSGSLFRRSQNTGHDVFLAKLAGASGDDVWGRQFDGNGADDRGLAVAALPGGDIAAAGCTRGELFASDFGQEDSFAATDGWLLRTIDPPPLMIAGDSDSGSIVWGAGILLAVAAGAFVALAAWRRRRQQSSRFWSDQGGRSGNSVELSLLGWK